MQYRQRLRRLIRRRAPLEAAQRVGALAHRLALLLQQVRERIEREGAELHLYRGLGPSQPRG